VRDALDRGYYERGDAPGQGHRNGHRSHRLKSAEGGLESSAPQVAGLAQPFRSALRAHLKGHTEALEGLAVEMLARGLSVRDIEDAFKDETGRLLLSRTAVCEIGKQLWEDYQAFKSRDLAEYDIAYLFIDGIAERIRPGQRREPVLAAWGFTFDGRKVLLHLMAGSKEDAETVSAFFQDMRNRGLGDPLLVVSDGAPGVIKAIEVCFPRSTRQRCLTGLLKNPGFREIHPDLVGLLGEPHEMLGRKERRQPELFIAGSLRDVLPDDHVLVRVDRVLDLSWLHDEIADLYDAAAGRPSIDPEVAVRLMLAGFLLGIVHDRRLLREAQVNLAIRWFCGYGLHEALPDHSSLTRIRQRWGAERFRRIFERTVRACVDAKIAKGEVVHVDASLTGPTSAGRVSRFATSRWSAANTRRRRTRPRRSAARAASPRRSAPPTPTPPWRPAPATGGWSRPTSSMPWSTTCAA
jgi:transposase